MSKEGRRRVVFGVTLLLIVGLTYAIGRRLEWGRYAELLGYNPDTQTFYLDEESFPAPP